MEDRYQSKNCLTSEKILNIFSTKNKDFNIQGNVFSIHIDHYEDTKYPDNLLISPEDWENVFSPLYNFLAFKESKQSKHSMLTPTNQKMLNRVDKKTRKPHFASGDDGVFRRMELIQIQLAAIDQFKLDSFCRPTIKDKEYYFLSKNGLQTMVDLAYNLAKEVSASGTKSDKDKFKKWMIDANANYERCGWGEFFGQNKKLVESVQQAQNTRVTSRFTV